MIALYLQANLWIAAAWMVFRILPKSRFSFRASKVAAQTLLVVSIFAPPAIAALPDLLFPRFSAPVDAMMGRDVDSLETNAQPVRRVLRQAAIAVTKPADTRGNSLVPWGIYLVTAGLVMMGARRARNWWRLRQLLRSTLSLHKIGRVRIAVSDSVSIPFSAMSLGKAYVVLPTALISYRHDFLIALRHEVEHHRRRDTVWAAMIEWLLCLFYLNPAIYAWKKSILELQELACDEALIGRMRISAHAYGSCLLRVAEMALENRFMLAGTTCMIPIFENNGHSFLRRRMNMFKQHERSPARKAVAVVIGTVSCLVIIGGAFAAQAALRSGGLPNPGKPIYDSRIQSLANEALKKGMADVHASAGFAIVADPVRGTVIAAVSINDGFDSKLRDDWALTIPLAPGSTLKPVIVALALQHKLASPTDMINCENGEYAFGHMLNHDSPAYQKLSVTDTIAHSSNICTIKIAQKLGAAGMESGFRDFGFGSGGTATDFPAARSGNIIPMSGVENDTYVALVSQGSSNRTGFYITPLELVQAYGAIANGGRLMRPIPANGSIGPEMIRDVITPDVASDMRTILRRVVTNGTGVGINGSSIALAGKTGSTIVNGNQRIGSFIGYAPADHPKVVIYVAIFDPKGKDMAGSKTAAPVFREIAEKVVAVFNPEN